MHVYVQSQLKCKQFERELARVKLVKDQEKEVLVSDVNRCCPCVLMTCFCCVLLLQEMSPCVRRVFVGASSASCESAVEF